MRQSKITFNYLVKPFLFPKRKILKQFILSHAKSNKRDIRSLKYVFCRDQYLLEINQQYLNRDYLTDVITFPYIDKITDPVTADVFISIDRVRENSSIHHVDFTEELLRIIFHGYLHALGIQDKTTEQKKQMKQKEDKLIRSFKHFVSRETLFNSTE